MSPLDFRTSEVAAATARGVRQCVMIGSGSVFTAELQGSPGPTLQVFAVAEEPAANPSVTFVPTQFASETVAAALGKCSFDKQKASLFVWLGSAAYRTADAVITTLSFIGSLPGGSGVVLDYAAESTRLGARAHSALDALASQIRTAGATVKYVIQAQAVAALLRGVGFRDISDHPAMESPLGR